MEHLRGYPYPFDHHVKIIILTPNKIDTMCCTVEKAKLSNTKILSLPLDNGNHFIAYGNSVRNESGKPNAMILPIPGRTKPEWFHNTKKYKSFLTDITKKATWMNWMGWNTRGLMKSASLGDNFSSYEKFQLGMYTVGLSDSFDGIAAFLNSLPDDERPAVSKELQEFFKSHYPNWSFAICCFNTSKPIDAQPIAFEYTPMDPNNLYFPTMDAHNGGAPDLDEKVEVDHMFIYEHTGPREDKYAMEHIDLDNVPDFLNKRKYRTMSMGGYMSNGDTVVNITEMSALQFLHEPEFIRAKNIFDRPNNTSDGAGSSAKRRRVPH